MPFLTVAGEEQLANKQANDETVNIENFVLAYVPDLGDEPEDRVEALPDDSLIVDTRAYSQCTYVSDNQVMYSLVMDPSVGDFEFNWIGLVDDEDVLIAVAYITAIEKLQSSDDVEGNTIQRYFPLNYTDIKTITGATEPAEIWLLGLDDDETVAQHEAKDDPHPQYKTYADELDAQNVKLTGDQTVAGTKTFSTAPQSSVSPTEDADLARKDYVDEMGSATLSSAQAYADETAATAVTNASINKLPTKVSMGMHNLFLVLLNGKLYSSTGDSSSNTNAGSGRGPDGTGTRWGLDGMARVAIPGEYDVVDFGGNGHTIVWALTEDGRLYTWGDNNYGECGLGHTDNVPYPELCLTGVTEVFQSCAKAYSVNYDSMYAIADGTLYCWGYNGNGQLLHGTSEVADTTNRTSPEAAYTDSQKARPLCLLGGVNGYAICTDDAGEGLYAVGDNDYGQWGRELNINWGGLADIKDYWDPDGTRGNAIAAKTSGRARSGSTYNQNTLYILFENGDLMSSGSNINGQRGENYVDDSTPSLIMSGVEDFYLIGSGRWSTLFVKDADGNLYTCGYNTYGQCGLGHTTTVTELTLTQTNVTRMLSDGWQQHSYQYRSPAIIEVMEDGAPKIYVCGYGDNYLLGNGSESSVSEWTELPLPGGLTPHSLAITNTGANSGICLLFTEEGEIYAWGRNAERGISMVSHGDVRVPWQVMPAVWTN